MADDRQGSPALRRALAAVDFAATAPGRARRLAVAAQQAADGDPEPVAVAERALGLAASARGELPDAVRHLRAAAALADDAGLSAPAARARMSLAYVLTLTGDTAGALHQTDLAAPDLHGISAVELRMQRALILTEIGRFAEAADGFEGALVALRRLGGDELLEADIRNNRAILHAHRRDWRAAQDDLRRAEALYTATGHALRTALVDQNRGMVAAVRGDVPLALTHYDRAARRYRDADRHPGALPIYRAETLLSVRLVAEARQAADAAVLGYGSARMAADLAHARLVLAQATLLDGEPAAAHAQAVRARRLFMRQQRPGWAALARYVGLRAQWAAGRHTAAVLRSGRQTVADLDAAGWSVAALDARLIVARVALQLGRVETARAELADAARARRDGPADLRARAWHAEALLRLSAGDRRGADAALRAGMGVLDRFRASLGATELRAHAAGHAEELAQLGLELAVHAGHAATVLAWAERWRAGDLRLRPVRPPDDAGLVDDLSALRQVVAELGTAAAEGGDTGALLRRQASLEQAVRRRARHAAGGRPAAARAAPALPELRAVLGNSALVEYVGLGDRLHAVVVIDRVVRLHDLGPLADAERALAGLRFGLRRLAYEVGSPRALAAVAEASDEAARELDTQLLGPLLDDIGDRPLVVVPTGALHGLPWASLPSCAARCVTVAPSATLWHRAASTPDPASTGTKDSGRQVLAAGPGLAYAAAEVATLARRYPGADRFTGRRASVDAVTRALDGAHLVHIAAHGHFRADNPLFSSIQFADGPLTVYDLERLRQPPRQVVLSSCESGMPAVVPGDELLGLAAALLAMGTRSLVASVIPVPDRASRPLMLRLHRYLQAGHSPSAALAKARGDAPPEGSARVAAAGFQCFGAG